LTQRRAARARRMVVRHVIAEALDEQLQSTSASAAKLILLKLVGRPHTRQVLREVFASSGPLRVFWRMNFDGSVGAFLVCHALGGFDQLGKKQVGTKCFHDFEFFVALPSGGCPWSCEF